MRSWGGVLAVLGLGALAGGMLFFGAVMAPLVFLHLPLPVAGPFIRIAFPWYYGYCIGSSAVAALGFLLRREFLALLVPLAVAGVTAWLWLYLLPALDAMRAAHDAAGFSRGHQLSVWLNGAELLAATMLLIRLAAKIK
jgi:hypothetical protein